MAQPPEIRFENFTSDHGLANTQVQTLLQDSKGFIWMGTLGGLHRYDGYSFTIFRHKYNDTTSIASNVILAMFEDRDGMLWLGTREGLVRYDSQQDKFYTYTAGFGNASWLSGKSIRAITEDKQGGLWVAVSGEGLIRFDKVTCKFSEQYVLDETKNDPSNGLMSNHIKSIVVDEHNRLWLATDNGLTVFNPSTKTFYTYLPGADKSTGLPNPFVKALCFDRQGHLWIGTDGGLSKATLKNGRILAFESFYADGSKSTSNSNDLIKALLEDQAGNIWIASDFGLSIYDPETNFFFRWRHNPDDEQSIGSNYCRGLLQDKQGIVWIATDRGFSKYDRGAFPFTTFSHDPKNKTSLSSNYVNAMVVGLKGRYWIGTDNGLNQFDPITLQFTTHSAVHAQMSSSYITSIASDRDGKLWLGTDKGLYHYNPDNKSLVAYMNDERMRTVSYVGGVLCLWLEKNDVLLAGTWDGLYIRQPGSEIFTRYLPAIKGRVQSMVRDDNGVLWVGTREYLVRVSNEQQEQPTLDFFQHQADNPASISYNNINVLFQSSTGVLWIGTAGGGLNYFDYTTGDFHTITWDARLPSDNIHGILEDQQQHLWISTDKGLCRFNLENKKITVYG